MNIINNFVKSFLSLFSSCSKSKKLKTVVIDDFPEYCSKGVLYVVGEDSPWYAVMLCPCGCKEIIRLCLQGEVSPSWNLRYHGSDDTVSLHPSIWRTNGCRSHFFIRNSSIVWIHDDNFSI